MRLLEVVMTCRRRVDGCCYRCSYRRCEAFVRGVSSLTWLMMDFCIKWRMREGLFLSLEFWLGVWFLSLDGEEASLNLRPLPAGEEYWKKN
ncbi:hypothetical protein HanIR_Chr06g0271241 [Helianthus annuus]|nr:hypothetical protein HanIR_Chr06g0271241 [Helianthus annuus]